MLRKANFSNWAWACSVSIACTLLAGPALHAQTQIERAPIADFSSDHGPIHPLQEITLTVHLKVRNQAAFDKAVEDLYSPGSPTYHQWMTDSDLARFAPSPAEIETVKKELVSNGLSILSVGSDNLSIRVRGAASSVERAFQTQIHEFEREGKTFHANVTPARLAGPAGSLVRSVTGLSDMKLKPLIKYQLDPRTGKPHTAPAKLPVATLKQVSGGWSGIATNDCFSSPSSVTLTTAGATLPVGIYFGNNYDTAFNDTPSISCSWTPSQLQTHYGLDKAYKAGLDGTKQTIVILDGPTDGTELTTDLALFSKLSGLPAINSSNFQILYPDGKPSALALQVENVQDESSLDVQWVHAMAPKAKIVIEILPTTDWTEFEFAIDFTRQNKIGNVMSVSYGLPEALFGAFTVQGFEQVLKKAAAAGIAAAFSSGDGGDEGIGSPSGGGALYPSTSAFVTAVGGTSIGIPNGTTTGAEVGWGNNVTFLSFATNAVLDPPQGLGNYAGAGGGVSGFIAKPSWQKSFPGTTRQAPDIAALADPFTGVVFVLGGTPMAGIGGTSLAAPIFSSIWAIADQKAGKPLGQAAPMLAGLAPSVINDVVPVSSVTNVSGVIVDSNGSTFYSSNDLLPPLFTTTKYVSAFWNLGGEYVDLSFGTDTSLTVTKGWDNVTGWGVPDGLSFITAAAKAK
ncbi:S8/S53 family peptidase [Alloacidobacterium dinghuense]|uniref:S8/S53 family peptidase n=1 Tax=Alloacidobacterium dinghuense TaxID=2763107 RepID=A0A7G8BEK6_9BACT|nr:S53 family peptidase [Alloacidobacterium dinghuense]QNI30976.1 S8/S53 family peptidase [Alloacidobacterium dinghuense]